ncbi:DUF421 domain-containing protein [Alkaliphilus pronyensis]|uniref:DUF421 domain-containing protein n=1 Tax=Alkaliphilus pronyensis TaxID=1482732 RepID=A0A6I0F6K6_9FIRM|nr:DUF421 domain-containing protein [Alkaliphilus pronyensis]KAB3531298.1 DUF421 domain-containing protein [Alkaliphilus pronyensis]
MVLQLIMESLILIVSGMLILRIAGRKSISQMTIAQTVVMISVGAIIIQPIIEDSIQRTIIAATVFVVFMIFVEYLQVKFDFIENLITGKAKIVIEDGIIVESNLKKLRFTADQLEMRLHQQGIANISDLKTATLEPNGQLGYELMPHAKPVTVGDSQQMLAPYIQQQGNSQSNPSNIFTEIREVNQNEMQ